MQEQLGEANRRLAVHEGTVAALPCCLGLTRSQTVIVEALYARSPRAVSRAVLMDKLYGDGDAPNDPILPIFICKIRQKLRPFDIEIGLQKTVGYFMDHDSGAALKAIIDRERAGPTWRTDDPHREFPVADLVLAQ